MSVQLDITAEQLALDGFRSLHAGDDYEYQFTYERGGVAQNLASAKLWFTIKEDSVESDAQAKLQLTSDVTAEIEITDAANGVFVVKFVSSGAKETSDLEGLWIYEIQVKMGAPSNEVITVARGQIEFLPNLTRTTA